MANKKNLDPFARRVPQGLGEVSNEENTIEDDNKSIAGLVPSDASTDEGYQKMLAIMNKQAIDDARDGITPYPNMGTVSTPAVTTARTATPLPVNNKPAAGTTVVKPLLNDVPKAEDDTPEEEKKPEIKDEDVLPMLDSILTRGYASETFSIRGNRVTLRTQFYWEEYAIRNSVELRLRENSLQLTADTLLQKYVLASCLESFGGNYFPPIAQGSKEQLDKSLQDRVDFLDSLPTILVWYLNKKRLEFNDKLLYLSDNFDKLIKAF